MTFANRTHSWRRFLVAVGLILLTTPALGQPTGSAPPLQGGPEAPTPAEPAPADAPPPPPGPAPPAPATGPEQVFPLKNGSMIRGRVVQQAPGQWVTVETAQGWRVTIPWQHIGPASAPPPTTAPAAGPAPGPGAPPPAVEPEKNAEPTGFRLGARLGAAFPVGKIESGDDTQLSRTFGTALPLTLDVGVQPSQHFYVGLYGSWVIGSAGSDADKVCTNVDCSVYGARLGLDLELRLPSGGSSTPWLSYSIGWSADEIDLDQGGQTEQHAWGGLDFATLLGGADFRLSDEVSVGPFGGVGLSLYLYEVDAVDGKGHNKSIDEPAVHGFIQVGARAILFP